MKAIIHHLIRSRVLPCAVAWGVCLAAPAEAAPKEASAPGQTNQCIRQTTVAELNSCEGSRTGVGLKKSGLGDSMVRPAVTKGVAKKSGMTAPSIELDAATRSNRAGAEARAYSLLQREVTVLQRLAQNTSSTDPKRPKVLLRLASTYFEMQQALSGRVRELDEPIHEARSTNNRAKANSLRQEQKKRESQLESVRRETVATYATLVRDHSDFSQMDEVLFSLAFGLEEVGEFDQARKVYRQLIERFENSLFVPHAWLSFAEYFFNNGEMASAIAFYEKVTAIPPARNPVYGYALYKSAWAHYNADDFKKSLARFIDVVEFARRDAKGKDSKHLAKQSLREMVVPYSRVGNPSASYQFFRRFAANDEEANELQERLAEVYLDTGRWEEATSTYRNLIARNPKAGRVCVWQSRVSQIAMSSRSKQDQFIELRRLIDLVDAFEKRNLPKEYVAECRTESATILISLATSWHRETVGGDGQPGTNDKATMTFAARLYDMLVERYPNLDQMQFPAIDKRDWPTRYRVAYYRAELLWKMEDWEQCGPAFDRVVELNPQGEYTEASAYAAVLCYNNLYQSEYLARERTLRPDAKKARGKAASSDEANIAERELTQLESGMLRAFERYICFIPDSKDLATIKYRRARIYYEANRFEEAAALFRDVVDNHGNSELAVYAANLYLDSLNMLGVREPAREEACLGTLVASMDPLWSGFCEATQERSANAELCDIVEQLRCDVVRKRAESFQAKKEFKRAAATYVTLFRKYQSCGGLDEVLYNAAINFEAARLLGRAIQVRKVLIERFKDSPLAKKAVYLIGANFHAMAFYEEAAKYYEQFASRYPGEDGSKCTDKEIADNACPVAQDALKNAVFFRLGLAQEEEATQAALMYEKFFQRRDPAQSAKVTFALGSLYEKPGTWFKAVDHYSKWLRKHRRSAYPHQLIQANMEIARAYWARDQQSKAGPYLNEVVSLWKRGAENSIKRLRLPKEDKELFVAQARDAVSEALFLKAESSYEKFRKIAFPTFRGGRSINDVNKWTKKAFMPWVKRKASTLKNAEAEYGQISPLDVPAWMIAAATRTGEMYRSFVDEFRDAPIPREVEADPELFDIYVGALDRESEPFKKTAESRFGYCLELSKKERWFNQWSRQCEAELNRLNPREYPLAAELRGTEYVEHVSVGAPRAATLSIAGDGDAMFEGK